MALRIKKAHHETVVGFNNNSAPLGSRDDLIDLAIMARESEQQSLIDLFEELPSLSELQRLKEGIILPTLPPIIYDKDSSKKEKDSSKRRGQTRR